MDDVRDSKTAEISPRSAWAVIGGVMAVGFIIVASLLWVTPRDIIQVPSYWLGVAVWTLVALLWLPGPGLITGTGRGRRPVLITEIVAILLIAFGAAGTVLREARDPILPFAWGVVGFPGAILTYWSYLFLVRQKLRRCPKCLTYRWFSRRNSSLTCQGCGSSLG